MDVNVYAQQFVAKLYADISITYKDTNHEDPGPDDEYQLEDIGDGWKYNVRVATFYAKFILPRGTKKYLHLHVWSSSFDNPTLQER